MCVDERGGERGGEWSGGEKGGHRLDLAIATLGLCKFPE
jgi:hypothetical protein